MPPKNGGVRKAEIADFLHYLLYSIDSSKSFAAVLLI
jgi:hypothetical protein